MRGGECAFILFGATGDLAKKKLIPALFALHKKGVLHKNTRIIAIGRRDYTDTGIRREYKEFCNSRGFQAFSRRIVYHPLEFSDGGAYERLGKRLDRLPKRIRNKRLFYLATPPRAFPRIVQHLHYHQIAQRRPKVGWHRVVFEKPFGSDLKSARQLNRVITRLFKEQQIYRIDHYVAKTLVQEILVFRFANPVFSQIWNSRHIRRVQIEAYEEEGVGTRAGYYDKYGALRDMVQNHLLQLFSLVAMEPPRTLSAEDIRDEKFRVLKHVSIPGRKEVSRNLVCGQYEGYTRENGIAKDSQTETYAAVRLEVNNRRWKGTPFYLVTGKKLKHRFAEIVVEFSSDECPLFQEPLLGCGENILLIRIQPDEGISFTFNLADTAGSSKVQPQVLDYAHEAKRINSPASYELLLREAMSGNQTLFTRILSNGLGRSWTHSTRGATGSTSTRRGRKAPWQHSAC